jgi:hypothetical protein
LRFSDFRFSDFQRGSRGVGWEGEDDFSDFGEESSNLIFFSDFQKKIFKKNIFKKNIFKKNIFKKKSVL